MLFKTPGESHELYYITCKALKLILYDLCRLIMTLCILLHIWYSVKIKYHMIYNDLLRLQVKAMYFITLLV